MACLASWGAGGGGHESARWARLTGVRQLGGSGVSGRVRPWDRWHFHLVLEEEALARGGQMASPVSCHLILSHLSQGAEEAGEGAGIVSLECVTNTSHGSAP